MLLVSSARRAPALVSAVLAAGLHEHERGTGSWHAEWKPLLELLHLAGGSAARAADPQRDQLNQRATVDTEGEAL